MASTADGLTSPYVELTRDDWAALRNQHPMLLSQEDVVRLRGLGERLDIQEIEEVYLPLSRLLSFYEQETERLHQVTSDFLGERRARTPFVIGVAGSVAVGKSTTARILQALIERWESKPSVELITTDGFLLPNKVLTERNLMARKGYPESYDRRALLRFVMEVKSGKSEVVAPVYSHLTYDIVPTESIVVRRPDVLIVEGLNVLQAPRQHHDGRTGLSVSDFFDFSVYVDAKQELIKRWYVDRFQRLRSTAFNQPESFFRRYANLDDDAAVELAESIWDAINGPNLIQNILPTRGRATLVLNKGEDHAVKRVRLRRL
ncbi:type I pantothenate kinase [Ornithinimicrobium cryptoxanthini]|uniref:Pantothenate kinase n=1 Tax=Ornithinimicrobium cryptoxanthini TaxID=2934161 RepID=A0ABY4YGH8_9MICO|nr:type I pantothenate kinase [Ornithinimicrobium cryptoxanthini]USQ75737.1 type I pantothenate kinase [Ornithinimicrobium cryptoxanthini]